MLNQIPKLAAFEWRFIGDRIRSPECFAATFVFLVCRPEKARYRSCLIYEILELIKNGQRVDIRLSDFYLLQARSYSICGSERRFRTELQR